jgi:tryptophan synthase alpha subunit
MDHLCQVAAGAIVGSPTVAEIDHGEEEHWGKRNTESKQDDPGLKIALHTGLYFNVRT